MKPEQLLRKLFPPMLATSADNPPSPERGWIYELKYDGTGPSRFVIERPAGLWVAVNRGRGRRRILASGGCLP